MSEIFGQIDLEQRGKDGGSICGFFSSILSKVNFRKISSKKLIVAPGSACNRVYDPSAPTIIVPAMNQAQRVHVIYSGNVQGVGFRFVTERIAMKMDLTGFVKNLTDGNVEVVCEGDKRRLEEFLDSIAEEMSGYIGDSRVEWGPYLGEFSSFDIRF